MSDLDRWAVITDASYPLDWNTRTELISRYIPNNVHVREFGAGRCYLGTLLENRDCTYEPWDQVTRGADCQAIDLNSPGLPELPWVDYTVFSGVLEYLYDLTVLAQWLHNNTECILASYATREAQTSAASAASAASDHTQRAANGWVSHESDASFRAIWEAEGYSVEAIDEWHGQTIYAIS